MEIETKCCDKEMIELGIFDFLNNNTIKLRSFVCGDCGKLLDIHNYTLDDDELLNKIENFDELKNTKIHKELDGNAD